MLRNRRILPGRFVGCLAVLSLLGAAAVACAPDSGRDGESEGRQIASVRTEEPRQETVDPLVAKYGEPVRLRLDMTEAEEIAAQRIYDACVEGESGVSLDDHKAAAGADRGVATSPDAEKVEEASGKCAVVAPLDPWEYDRQNPDAADFSQAIVDCLHDRGVTYVEVVETSGRFALSFGGPDNDSSSVSLGLQHYPSCEAEVVAKDEWRR